MSPLPLLALVVIASMAQAADYVHNPIQYHSQKESGAYNYGYDTGLFGSHQFHQERKDAQGDVRGRYGYTDPDGKLRLVYYTAGRDGYNIVKDVDASSKDAKDDLSARPPSRPSSASPSSAAPYCNKCSARKCPEARLVIDVPL